MISLKFSGNDSNVPPISDETGEAKILEEHDVPTSESSPTPLTPPGDIAEPQPQTFAERGPLSLRPPIKKIAPSPSKKILPSITAGGPDNEQTDSQEGEAEGVTFEVPTEKGTEEIDTPLSAPEPSVAETTLDLSQETPETVPEEKPISLVEETVQTLPETMSPEGVVVRETQLSAESVPPVTKEELVDRGVLLEGAIPETAVKDPLFAARVLESQRAPERPIPVPSMRVSAPTARVTKPSIVRTFEGDVARAMQKERVSLAGMVLAEERKREEKREIMQFERTWGTRVVLVTLGLFVVSGAIIWGAFYFKKLQSERVTTPTRPQSLLFVENDVDVVLSRAGRKVATDAIANAIREAPGRLDTMTRILPVRIFPGDTGEEPTREALTAPELLSVWESKASEKLKGALTGFFLGSYRFDGNQPFLLLKTNVFESAFSGILDWEEDGLAEELFAAFGKPLPTREAEKTFIDVVMKNRDARAVLDGTGKPLLFYVFIDRETVLFATDESTLDEVVRRYYRRAP